MPRPTRILLIADTHLGFDLPFRPRVERRRRGPDFFANLERALEPVRRSEVDLVVHGGDLLYRSRVPAALVEMALEPLIGVAESGVPVYLVPGNHERSRIPLHLWARHPNLHIFDEPRTFLCETAGGRLALSGFPFVREVRDRFAQFVAQTRHGEAAADAHLLCFHQTVEGAQVGPGNYTFRGGADVVRGRDIPRAFAAVLAGHIHRAQVLTHDLSRRRLATKVIYPGSIERTAFAEREEEKGYAMVSLDGGEVSVSFVRLPARPMVVVRFEPVSSDGEEIKEELRRRLAALDPESVVRLELGGAGAAQARAVLTAATVRTLAPPTMNVEVAPERRVPA